jgi:hypothetical protein
MLLRKNLEKHPTSEIKYQQQKRDISSVNTTCGKIILPRTQLPRGRQTLFFSLCLGAQKTYCYLNVTGEPNAETYNQKSINKQTNSMV